MSTFGTQLTELRREKGLTQKTLAQELGFTKNTVSAWERDVRKPEFETLTDLCSFFNVNMGYLLGEDVARMEAPGAVPDDETAAQWVLDEVVEKSEPFLQKYMQLSPEARQIIHAAITAAYKYEKANGDLYTDGKRVRLTIAREDEG